MFPSSDQEKCCLVPLFLDYMAMPWHCKKSANIFGIILYIIFLLSFPILRYFHYYHFNDSCALCLTSYIVTIMWSWPTRSSQLSWGSLSGILESVIRQKLCQQKSVTCFVLNVSFTANLTQAWQLMQVGILKKCKDDAIWQMHADVPLIRSLF